MKLRKVISGGQTGADQQGLLCARELGLETGGTAPKGYRTEKGKELWLKDYGLIESPYWEYKPRTHQNAADAEATVWFGNIGSPGYWCTRNGCRKSEKTFWENPSPTEFKVLADRYEVLNIAGNRASKNSNVIEQVKEAFKELQNERN